jgi:hypothetical protein
VPVTLPGSEVIEEQKEFPVFDPHSLVRTSNQAASNQSLDELNKAQVSKSLTTQQNDEQIIDS